MLYMNVMERKSVLYVSLNFWNK